VLVETDGLVVDGVDDDETPSGRLYCGHGPAQGVDQELAADVLDRQVNVASKPSQEDRRDHIRAPSPNLGWKGVAAHLVRAKAEVGDNSIVVRPHESSCRPGAVGVQRCGGQPLVEDLVAAGEGFDLMVVCDALREEQRTTPA
jgi:hypothetical protein